MNNKNEEFRPEKLEVEVDKIVNELKKDYAYCVPEFTVSNAKRMATIFWRESSHSGIDRKTVASVSVHLACENCGCPIPQRVLRGRTLRNPKNIFRKMRKRFSIQYPVTPRHWKRGIFDRLRRQKIWRYTGGIYRLHRVYPYDLLKNLEENFDKICDYYEIRKELRRKLSGKPSRHIALTFLYLAALELSKEELAISRAEHIKELFFVSDTALKKNVKLVYDYFKECGEVDFLKPGHTPFGVVVNLENETLK